MFSDYGGIPFSRKVLIKLMFFEYCKQKEHLVFNVFYFNSDFNSSLEHK